MQMYEVSDQTLGFMHMHVTEVLYKIACLNQNIKIKKRTDKEEEFGTFFR